MPLSCALRHPSRTVRARISNPLSRGRRVAKHPRAVTDQTLSAGHRFAPENSQPSQHCGETAAPGRRIKIRLDGSDVDIRVSVIPMLHGEAVVLRLLRQNSTLLGMGEMGMDARELKSFRRVLGLPHGIILVTGPTGSGKTTTLYTALNEINDQVRKIITIEDPIEYQLKGINQIQVSEKPDFLRAGCARFCVMTRT